MNRDSRVWEEWAAASGVLYFLSFAAAVVIGAANTSPDASASVADLRAWYGVFQPAGQWMAVAVAIGAGGLLWFTGSVRSAISKLEGGARLASLAFGGGLVASVMVLASIAIVAQPGFWPAEIGALDDGALAAFHLALLVVSSGLVGLGTVGWGLMALAVAIAGFRLGFGSRWMSWAAAVVAALSLIGLLGVTQPQGLLGLVWFVGYVFFPVWLLLLSIQLIRAVRAEG